MVRLRGTQKGFLDRREDTEDTEALLCSKDRVVRSFVVGNSSCGVRLALEDIYFLLLER